MSDLFRSTKFYTPRRTNFLSILFAPPLLFFHGGRPSIPSSTSAQRAGASSTPSNNNVLAYCYLLRTTSSSSKYYKEYRSGAARGRALVVVAGGVRTAFGNQPAVWLNLVLGRAGNNQRAPVYLRAASLLSCLLVWVTSERPRTKQHRPPPPTTK